MKDTGHYLQSNRTYLLHLFTLMILRWRGLEVWSRGITQKMLGPNLLVDKKCWVQIHWWTQKMLGPNLLVDTKISDRHDILNQHDRKEVVSAHRKC